MHKIEDYKDHELIKTTKVFLLLQPDPLSQNWAWPLPVYFDRTSDVYRVFSPDHHDGVYFESPELPSDGVFEFLVPNPVQFAKGFSTDIIKVIVKDGTIRY